MESLTVLAAPARSARCDPKSFPTVDPATERILEELRAQRLVDLLRLIERNSKALTTLQYVLPMMERFGLTNKSDSCHGWLGLDLTLPNLHHLLELGVHGREDICLQDLPCLRRLTVWYQDTSFAVEVDHHTTLEEVRLHFSNRSQTKFSRTVPNLLDFGSLPALKSLDLFAGGLLEQVSLDIFSGNSRSLRKVRVCGPFWSPSLQSLAGFFKRFASTVEVLSLARICMRRFQQNPVRRTLMPMLRCLESHDVPPELLLTMFLPKLTTLVIVTGPLVSSVTLASLLESAHDSLQTVSIASTDTSIEASEVHLMHQDFVWQLLRCFQLRRLQIRGHYYFHRLEWHVLCRRLFPSLRSVCVWQPPLVTTFGTLGDEYFKNSTDPSKVPFLTTVSESCLLVHPSERQLWHFHHLGSDIRERMYWRFFGVAEGTTELTIARGAMPTKWTVTGKANETQEGRVYSGQPLFMDRGHQW